MNAQPCLPQEILEVNRNKEYTLISTELLESVLTDTRLNAQTSKLWQILFNKARYSQNLEVKVSYSHLANKLNKSTRTIARYVESLQNAGYLIVQHNFDKNGGQRPSTISVRVPTVFIEHANQKKDRGNKKHYDNNDSLVTLDTGKKAPYNKISPEENSVNVSFPDSNSPSVLCGTICNIQVETEVDSAVNPESHANNNEIHGTTIVLPSPDETVNLISSQDKNDMGGYDINVLQKDTNKKEINKNNNNVGSFSRDKQKIIFAQNQIDDLKKQLTEENKKLSAIKDKTLLYDQIKKTSEIDASLYLAKINLERIEKEINEKEKQNKVLRNLDNPEFMLNRAGERPLSSFTFKRLVRSLESYGYQGNKLNCLINEIVFEARFGSLVSCNKTKKPLSIDNAINISLKLIRDERWSTPTLLKNLGEIG